jgi:hypothetical protein
MNIHLPAILMFTRGTRFWPIPGWLFIGVSWCVFVFLEHTSVLTRRCRCTKSQRILGSTAFLGCLLHTGGARFLHLMVAEDLKVYQSLSPINGTRRKWFALSIKQIGFQLGRAFIKSQAVFGRKEHTFAYMVRLLQSFESDARENVDTWLIFKGPGIGNVDLLHWVVLRPMPGALLVCNKHWACPN